MHVCIFLNVKCKYRNSTLQYGVLHHDIRFATGLLQEKSFTVKYIICIYLLEIKQWRFQGGHPHSMYNTHTNVFVIDDNITVLGLKIK